MELGKTIIHHRPEEGVLFWGGPWHNKVVPQDQRTINRGRVKVPMPHRSSAMAYRPEIDYAIPIQSTISTVTYAVHRFSSPLYRDTQTAEIWCVLIYMENEERLLENLKGTVKSLLQLVPNIANK